MLRGRSCVGGWRNYGWAYVHREWIYRMRDLSERAERVVIDKRLTWVVMSHEQPVALRRALQFHDSLPGCVMVLDTSAQPAREVVSHYPHADYQHVPQLAAVSDQERYAFAVQRVQTPYVVFVSDDDFLVAAAVELCLDFLDDNPEYGFCRGYSLGYLATGTEIKYCLRQRKGPEDHASDDPAERVLGMARHYVPLLKAIIRTELLARWYASAPTLDSDYLQIGQAIFLLHEAKGRVLPVAYSVQALNYPEAEPEARAEKKLLGTQQAVRAEREQFIEGMTALPELSSQGGLIRDVLGLVGQCLTARASLTLQEIFSSELSWRQGSQHNFQPVQYVEMPFYNQAFFDVLEQIEFFLHALPGGGLQGQALEGILLEQRELVRPRKGQDSAQARERVEQGFDLYPFDTGLGDRLLSDLDRQGNVALAQRLEIWLKRLQEVHRAGPASILEDSLSGMLYERLHAWQPDDAQLLAMDEVFQAHGSGPLIGLVLLDLAGDVDKLQASLDSLLEGAFTRYQIIVLTTATPPVATRATDRLHFVRVPAVDWQHHLNRVVEQAGWQWLLVCETGVCFTPFGLLKVASELLEAESCRAVYCDELQRLAGGTLTSLYRPSFNLDLLLSSPRTMAHHWLVRREVFVELGGYSARYPQASALDFILRMIEAGGMSGIGHIDELLLVGDHDASESNLDELNTLRRHLQARGYERGVVQQTHPRAYHLRYGHGERPLVSILVPTRDQLAMVSRCIESIFQRTRYTHFEVILIDNLSETEEARHWLAGLEAMPDDRIRVLRYPHPFNFSAMNNHAARVARGEYLVLLNNDTEIIDANWLDELLNHAQRPEVGIVGARLHYPNGSLQHAGVLLGLRGPAEHPWLGRDPQAPSYMGRSQVDQNFSAVTAACLMVRKSVYEQVEGLDEQAFAVSYNDVDLCLKVGVAGYLTVWAHRAVVMHEGSVSQVTVDPLDQGAKRLRFVKEQRAFYERWLPMLINDPAYNRNLALCGNGFEVDDKPLLAPEQRTQPLVLALTGLGPRARLAQEWSGLQELATVTVAQQNLQVPELLRMAPDVVVVPGMLCQSDPLALSLCHQYFRGIKVLDLCAGASLGCNGSDSLPEDILRALPLVDRVLTADARVARALEGLHGDVRVVPSLFEGDSVASGTAGQALLGQVQLQACLP
ncbi:glycosyltransferase family 2 protein [Pseudomonas putida]